MFNFFITLLFRLFIFSNTAQRQDNITKNSKGNYSGSVKNTPKSILKLFRSTLGSFI